MSARAHREEIFPSSQDPASERDLPLFGSRYRAGYQIAGQERDFPPFLFQKEMGNLALATQVPRLRRQQTLVCSIEWHGFFQNRLIRPTESQVSIVRDH